MKSDTSGLGILFSPNAVTILDMFRAFGAPGNGEKAETLNRLEASLAQIVGQQTAGSIASDVLLFNFALRRCLKVPLRLRHVSSRIGTIDEYCLLTLVSSADDPESELAQKAAAALGIIHEVPLMTLAIDISRALKALPFKTSFLEDNTFSVMQGMEFRISDEERKNFDEAASKFRFNP